MIALTARLNERDEQIMTLQVSFSSSSSSAAAMVVLTFWWDPVPKTS